jgi:hypothetical protein
MKKLILTTIIFISLIIIKCNQDNNPIDSNTPVVDPITRIWTNIADSNYTFFFVTHDSTVSRGIFWGNEDNPAYGETELCGFFDGTYVEFDVKRPLNSRIKFTGKFINSNRIELQSSEGSLVITR